MSTDIKRLVGDDGQLLQIAVGAAGASIPAKSWVQIATKKASASAFGGTLTTGLLPGDFYYNPTAAPIALTGETASPLTLTSLLDLSSWSLEFTADEVAVTVLADTVKKYRKGKADANGQLEAVFMKGTTDLPGGFSNYFMPTADISATGTVTYSPRLTTPLYLLGYLDVDAAAGGITLATIFQIELFSFALPMNSGEAVKISPKFRLVGATNPTMFRITAP